MNTKLIFLMSTIMMCISNKIESNIPEKDGFERFPNHYFVETGTFGGQGVRLALRAHFPEIHSIELDTTFHRNALHQFRTCKNVHIWHGNSGTMLYDVIKGFDKPITFWLDAHNGTYDPRGNNTPILQELDQIKKHHIKTHTILIDDMHCCNAPLFDYITKDMLRNKLLEINPNYTVSYIDGGQDGEYPNNIMIAYVAQ